MLSMSGRVGRGKGEGWIQLLVFRVLYDTPLHGYALIKELNELLAGRRPIKPGSLYTMLRRLEKEDLLSSKWKKNTPHLDRRVYSLTEAGMEKLKEGRLRVKEQKRILDEMTNFYENNFIEREKDDGN